MENFWRNSTGNPPGYGDFPHCIAAVAPVIAEGLLISYFCALSYRFGRKIVFFLTMVLQAATALVQATSVSWVMFCILNFLRGIGQISNYMGSLVLGEAARTFLSVSKKSQSLPLLWYLPGVQLPSISVSCFPLRQPMQITEWCTGQ